MNKRIIAFALPLIALTSLTGCKNGKKGQKTVELDEVTYQDFYDAAVNAEDIENDFTKADLTLNLSGANGKPIKSQVTYVLNSSSWIYESGSQTYLDDYNANRYLKMTASETSYDLNRTPQYQVSYYFTEGKGFRLIAEAHEEGDSQVYVEDGQIIMEFNTYAMLTLYKVDVTMTINGQTQSTAWDLSIDYK